MFSKSHNHSVIAHMVNIFGSSQGTFPVYLFLKVQWAFFCIIYKHPHALIAMAHLYHLYGKAGREFTHNWLDLFEIVY